MENQFRSYFKDNREKYLTALQQMVSINSFTANPSGVNELGRFTAEKFSVLGFQPEYIQSVNPEFGKHLVLTRRGLTNRKIGLITHLDTVFPPEEEEANHFYWHRVNDLVYGPGTNDIKGGTVMILMVMEGLYHFAKKAFDQITWVILANAAEERWSFDFGKLCNQHLNPNGIAALVFEAGYLEDNQLSLVTSRKGMAVYDIEVEGKSAHAGNGHPSGANALLQMAEIIQQISTLTDYKRDLTFNVGVLTGGTVPNRVPHFAKARGEMRTFVKNIFHESIQRLLEINNIEPIKSPDGEFSCNIDIRVILENPPWPTNPCTEKLFEVWKEVAKSMEMDLIHEARGGLSDGNQLWDWIPTIDGLGPNGRNAHCSERAPDGSKDQEYVTISSFTPKAVLNTLAILKLLESN